MLSSIRVERTHLLQDTQLGLGHQMSPCLRLIHHRLLDRRTATREIGPHMIVGVQNLLATLP